MTLKQDAVDSTPNTAEAGHGGFLKRWGQGHQKLKVMLSCVSSLRPAYGT